MGHTNYLTLVYRRYSEKELEQFYRESMAAVLIFMEQEQVAKLREDTEKSRTELQTLVNGLTAENLTLKAR